MVSKCLQMAVVDVVDVVDVVEIELEKPMKTKFALVLQFQSKIITLYNSKYYYSISQNVIN